MYLTKKNLFRANFISLQWFCYIFGQAHFEAHSVMVLINGTCEITRHIFVGAFADPAPASETARDFPAAVQDREDCNEQVPRDAIRSSKQI